MARVNAFGISALACLALAAGLNIFLYPLSFWFRVAFFFIPVALGAYGVLTRSRAFALSAGASLVLVSLRPEMAREWVALPFAVLFIAYLELAEASVRFHGAQEGVRRRYALRGGLVAGMAALLALAAYHAAPVVTRLVGETASQAAVFDTIYLPALVGLGLFAVVYLAGVAVKG
jgi:hypothetical protein